jgi:glycosyltransferase involved in cell wall biosynthesis
MLWTRDFRISRCSMLKDALVIHPQFSYYAGGELLCLYVCKALQELGYNVTIACDVFNPADVERLYGLGQILQSCKHKKIDAFLPAFPFLVSIQRIPYAIRTRTFLSRTKADVIFSTQSSSFYIPKGRLFHFVYNILDLFNHPSGSSLLGPETSKDPAKAIYYFLLRQLRRLFWDRYAPKPTLFFAVGSLVLRDLQERGYQNSRMIFPPCRTSFKPSFPKKNQVVQYTRILPNKRIELFSEIARLLPQYPFYLVGRIPLEHDIGINEYSQRVLSGLPENVTFVNALTRERPDLLESSKVYLYTGSEAGIGVALVEAISAGCIPFSPRGVGAVDIIEAAGIGQVFDSPQQAAENIKLILEANQTPEQIYEISQKASLFGSDRFEEQIKKLARWEQTA